MASGEDRRRSDPVIREQDLERRERAVANRETWIRAREHVTGEHAIVLADREADVEAREATLQTRRSTDALLLQLREANENLVMAALRAEHLADEAVALHLQRDREVRSALRGVVALLEQIEDAGAEIAEVRQIVAIVERLLAPGE